MSCESVAGWHVNQLMTCESVAADTNGDNQLDESELEALFQKEVSCLATADSIVCLLVIEMMMTTMIAMVLVEHLICFTVGD